jgi:hypothetical protein
MVEASYEDGWGLRSNSKYTKHSATSGTRLIFMSLTQMMIGSDGIRVAVMLTETAATHSPLSKLMDSLN